MERPIWMTYRVKPTADPGIPPMTAEEERAYCRVWGIPYYPRRKFNPFSNTPHKRSAFAGLPSLPAKIRNLSGQLSAFR